MSDDEPDTEARRRFLRGAGLVGAAGVGGAAAGFLAAELRDDRSRATAVVRVQAGGTNGTDDAARTYLVTATGGSGDTLAINAAIEAAAESHGGTTDLPGGGLVVLGGGQFRLTGPVVVRPGVTLAGSGWGTQLIRGFDGGPLITFQASRGEVPGAYAAEVRDLYLIGGRASYGHPDNVGVLLDATNPDDRGWTDPNCRLHGLRVAYCAGHGIEVASHPGSRGTTSRACLLTGCFVTACAGDGFRLDGSDATVTDCYSAGNDGAGYAVEAGNVTLSACKASYNDRNGFTVTSQRALLSACQSQDNQPDGFHLAGTSGTTVSGCQGDTNRAANLRLADTTATSVSGLVSVFREGGRFKEPPTDGGVVIGGGTSGCLVSGVAPASAGGQAGPTSGNTVELAT